MKIFILLALVLGASASRNCPTAKDICAGHAKCVATCPCPFCMPQKPVREFIRSGHKACCFGMTANCLACSAGQTLFKYCAENPDTSGCKTEVELSAVDHLWGSHKVDKPRACCRAYTASCMACAAGITVKHYCAEKPDTSGCKSVRRTEVELSALDTLEALLARTAGMSEDHCAENPNTSECRMIKEKFCERNPESLYCTPQPLAEVELSARCCNGFILRCLACSARMTEKEYCAKNPNTLLECDPGMTVEQYCAANRQQIYQCRIPNERHEFCVRFPTFPDCTPQPRTEVELSAVDHLWGSHRVINSSPRCCFGRTAACLACASRVTEKVYCARNPDTSGCRPNGYVNSVNGVRREEVELSALDTLEALLARRYHNRPTKPQTNPNTGWRGKKCCFAKTAECLACHDGRITVEEYCAKWANSEWANSPKLPSGC